MGVGRFHGGYANQEGMTVPATSPWGQALREHTGMLIDQPPVLQSLRLKGYGGTVGGVVTVQANTQPIYTGEGYFGDLPQTNQPEVNAPPPWTRV